MVADGALGLISAIGEIWPRADRQHCCVHRLRNLLAKLPKDEQDRVRFNYWAALTDATSVNDGKLRLQVLISELEHRGYESAARCLAEDLDALVVHLRYPLRHRERWRSTNWRESEGELSELLSCDNDARLFRIPNGGPGEAAALSALSELVPTAGELARPGQETRAGRRYRRRAWASPRRAHWSALWLARGVAAGR